MEVVGLKRKKGEVRLRFARTDKPVNVLDLVCIEQLEAHLDALEKEPPEVLVLESGMPGCFIAGADLDVIAAIADADEAERLAERGQAACRRIEDLPSVSIAVVDGACMGGGLEIAMACDYIIAVHGAKTKLSLPEIMIGIHPGFGGCVRLPKRVGWLAAVNMILTGKAVDAKKAKRMGLAAIACHAEQIEDAITYMAGRGKPKRKGVRPWWLRLWPAKAVFFQQVRKRALARLKHVDVGEAYPAVPAAIDLLQELVGMSDGLAYAREAESLGRLAVTPTCKHLIRVFHLGQELQKQDAARQGREAASSVDHVAVFGAGVMGSGIAWVAAKSTDVDLHDISVDALSHGLRNMGRFAKRHPGRMKKIRPAMDMSGLEKSKVVIEAVLEEIKIKEELWTRVEASVPKEALLLSNTSSLSISEMQKHVKHPGRMAGLHFFNPAPKMPLVEVVAGDNTAEKTVQTTAALATGWGKYPVIVADKPGFLVNRCLMPYMTAALRLAGRGQSPEHVDGVLKHFGMPMGAFELADRVGLDICRHVGEQLSTAFGAHQALPKWFSDMVDDGLLGEKSDKGFFLYEKGKQGKLNPDLHKYLKTPGQQGPGTDANIGGKENVMSDAEVEDACLLPMLVEALACLQEKVVDRAEHLDAAMIYGIGFPPFRGGLLHHFAGEDAKVLKKRIGDIGLKVPKNLGVIHG